MDIALILIFGLVIGSFVAAFTYRVPRNIDFIFGRSFCDFCKKDLSWYDNVPLFSYLYYGGKSRCCSQKISIRYLLIEVASTLGFIVVYLSSLSPIYYILYTACLAVYVIDFEHQIIPDELSWLLFLFGLSTTYNILYTNLFAGFLLSLLLLVLYLVTRGRGIGLGDVKLAIPLGFILGLEKGIYWIAISFILGGIVASILLILKRANLKTKIAFGPFMIIAFWIIICFWDVLFIR